MKYYHVSSLVQSGQILRKDTKRNYSCCEFISNCDVSSYEKFLNILQQLSSSNIFNITGRSANKWTCEAVFENIRSNCYPNKPSRVWSVYLSKTFEEALKFYTHERKPHDTQERVSHIFEIDLPDIENVSVFDMTLFEEAEQSLYVEDITPSIYAQICQKAHMYWNNTKTPKNKLEYLVDCEITIGKQLV